MCKVFISYRREGGEYLTGRIYDYLTNHGISVFYDMESLHTGKFDDQLYNKIEECQYFIAVLPPNALDRCVSEDDWVRQEIARAIELKKIIIPILMPGFTFPKELPPDISEIASYQGFVVNNAIFKEQMNHLIETLTSGKKEKKSKKILISCISAVAVIAIIVGIIVLPKLTKKDVPPEENQNSVVDPVPEPEPPKPESPEPEPPEPEIPEITHEIDTYTPAIGMNINELKKHFDEFELQRKTSKSEIYSAKTEKLDKNLLFTLKKNPKNCISIDVPLKYLFPDFTADANGDINIEDIEKMLGKGTTENNYVSIKYADYEIHIQRNNKYPLIDYENTYCQLLKSGDDNNSENNSRIHFPTVPFSQK